MATTIKLLAQTGLTSPGPDTVYTCPALTTAIIKHISICNTHASSARVVDIQMGDSGSEQYLRKNISIASNDTFTFTSEGHDFLALEAADVLKMTCATGGTDLDVLVCGIEET